jgi:hypothetical protein
LGDDTKVEDGVDGVDVGVDEDGGVDEVEDIFFPFSLYDILLIVI